MAQLADLQPLMQEVQRLWQWWTSELVACLPRSVLDRLHWRPRTEIRPGRDGVNILCIDGKEEQLFREDRPLATLDDAGWQELASLIVDRSASLILASRDVHCFALDLPRRSGRNLPATIALQLEVASPLDPARALWSWTLLQVDRNRAEVLVALAKASAIDELDRQFAQRGLACPPIFCETAAGLIRLREGRRVFHSLDGQRNRRAVLVSLLIFAALPFLLLACGQFLLARDTSRLETVRRDIAPKLEADRLARQQAKLWQAYAPLRRIPPANVILGDLGRRTPTGLSIENILVERGSKVSFDLVGDGAGDSVEALVQSDGLLLIDAPAISPTEADPGTVTLVAQLP
jgi:hypothetical protein